MIATVVDMGRPKKPPSESIRITKPLAKKARIVAAALDMSMPEYIDSRLIPIVERDLKDVLAGLSEDESPKPRRKATGDG